jgi:hypothetical protein
MKITMKKFIIPFCSALLIVALSNRCRTDNRNSISFDVSVSAIEDSLRVMKAIICSHEEGNYRIYDDYNLFIGGNKVAVLNSDFVAEASLDTVKFSKSDIRFFKLIIYLKNNKINYCYRDRSFGGIVHGYLPAKDDRFDNIREIILLDSSIDNCSIDFQTWVKILDRKGNLILTAPKEAKLHYNIFKGYY